MFPPGSYDYVHILCVIQLPLCTMIGGVYTMSLKNVANISIKFLGSCFVCSPCSRIVLVTNDDQRSKQFKENANMNKVTSHIHRKCDICAIFIEDQLMQYMMRDQSN